jgi:hypothetical protein
MNSIGSNVENDVVQNSETRFLFGFQVLADMSHIPNDLTLAGLSSPNISSSFRGKLEMLPQAIKKGYKRFLWDTETYKHIVDLR